MSEKIQKILRKLPSSPGIYQFFDVKGEIIYIGKSVSLKNRVNSYFKKNAKLNFAKKKMIKKIVDVKIIVVNNETESLILETNLIKTHKPKYNILMKDDKNHLYIKITKEDFPKIIKTRIKNKSGEYFGPYLSSAYVEQILKFVKKYFGYGVGNHHFFHSKNSYNLDRYLFKNIPPSNSPLSKGGESKVPLLTKEGLGEVYNQNLSKTNLTPTLSFEGEGAEIKNFPSPHKGEGAGGGGSSKVEEKEIYSQKISQIKDFLKQDFKKIIPKLEKEMQGFATNLEFERAGEIKKTIEAIKSLEINQIARDSIAGDYDIINFLEKYDTFFIAHIILRDGKIVGMQNFEIENKLEEEKEEILYKFIEQNIVTKHLEEGGKGKVKILMSENITPLNLPLLRGEIGQSPAYNSHIVKNKESKIPLLDKEGLGEVSNTKNGILDTDHYIIEFPKIGPKKELLELAYRNIYEYAHKKHISSLSTKGFTKKNMQDLLAILGYKQINKNIIFECNDISHISGNHTVASRSIIENGKPNQSKYKKYKIKTLEEQKIDDFASMKEIITRRLKEMENLGNIPDLIIIDGGKGQLGSVMKVVEEFNKISRQNLTLNPSPVEEREIATPLLLAKEKGLGDEVLKKLQIVSIAKKEEELFLPGKSKPIIFDKNSRELKMIQKIRDEAHRFAISFNRDSRIKAMKKNILESLPGFGVITRKKLLKEYGSVENLKNIEKEELQKYINKKQMETLENHGII